MTKLPTPTPATVSKQTEERSKSFLTAAADGDVAKTQAFLDHGVPVNTADSSGQTALHLAAARNHVGVISLLLHTHTPKVDVNARDFMGRTALHCAAVRGHLSACEVLLEGGAEPMISDSCGQRPEDLAAHENYREILELLSSIQEEHQSEFGGGG